MSVWFKSRCRRIGLFLECCLLTLTQSESLFFFAQCNVKVNHGAFFATSPPPSPPTFNHRFIIKPQPVKCLWVCGEKGLCSMMMSKIQLNVIFTHTSLSAMVGCHANSKSFHQTALQKNCKLIVSTSIHSCAPALWSKGCQQVLNCNNMEGNCGQGSGRNSTPPVPFQKILMDWQQKDTNGGA